MESISNAHGQPLAKAIEEGSEACCHAVLTRFFVAANRWWAATSKSDSVPEFSIQLPMEIWENVFSLATYDYETY